MKDIAIASAASAWIEIKKVEIKIEIKKMTNKAGGTIYPLT